MKVNSGLNVLGGSKATWRDFPQLVIDLRDDEHDEVDAKVESWEAKLFEHGVQEEKEVRWGKKL